MITAKPTGGTPQVTPLPTPIMGTTVVAEGKLASPYPKLALAFEGSVSGRVLSITVKAGDVVSAGALLAVLDATEAQREVQDAQQALDRAIADRARALAQWERDVVDAEQALATAQRALQVAQLNYSKTGIEEASTSLAHARATEADAADAYNQSLNRPQDTAETRETYYETLQNAIRDRELAEMRLADAQDSYQASYVELQAKEADVVKAERNLAALEDGIDPVYDRAVEDAEQRLSQAQDALEDTRLTAPWEAVVLSVDIAPQAQVSAGTPVVTLLSLEDGLRFITENLSEQHVADVRPGQRAIVTLRTFVETPLEGTVEAVVPQVDSQVSAGGAQTTDARFTVRVQLASTDLNLLPGLTGRVEILTQGDSGQ
jgi:multidrug efflux pump subunit AcrA (membrane-fusion protein)